VGLFLGVTVAFAARLGARPKISAAQLVRPISILVACVAATALSFGLAAHLLVSDDTVNNDAIRELLKKIPVEKHKLALVVDAAHTGAYLAGFLGGIILSFWVVIARASRSNEPTSESPQNGSPAGPSFQSGLPWWSRATIIAVFAMTVTYALLKIPPGAVSISIIVGVLAFIVALIINPEHRYFRAFSALLGSWITVTAIPNVSFAFNLLQANGIIESVSPQSWTFHVGCVAVMLALLVLDFIQRSGGNKRNESAFRVPRTPRINTLRIATPKLKAADNAEGDGLAIAKRFLVAFSFPGEQRPFVEQIADSVAQTVTKERVFYDRYYEAELARPNLDTYLQKLYHEDSRLVVVALCAEYDEKEWCGLEFRAIRNLIKKRRDSEIMFVRVGEGDVKGVFGIDGYVDAINRPAAEIAEVILKRLASLTP
jgi:hypothetical protein